MKARLRHDHLPEDQNQPHYGIDKTTGERKEENDTRRRSNPPAYVFAETSVGHGRGTLSPEACVTRSMTTRRLTSPNRADVCAQTTHAVMLEKLPEIPRHRESAT